MRQDLETCNDLMIERYLAGELDCDGHKIEVRTEIVNGSPVQSLVIDGVGSKRPRETSFPLKRRHRGREGEKGRLMGASVSPMRRARRPLTNREQELRGTPAPRQWALFSAVAELKR